MGECHATAGSRCRGTRVILHERRHRFAQLRPSQKISHRILERPFDVGLHIFWTFFFRIAAFAIEVPTAWICCDSSDLGFLTTAENSTFPKSRGPSPAQVRNGRRKSAAPGLPRLHPRQAGPLP